MTRLVATLNVLLFLAVAGGVAWREQTGTLKIRVVEAGSDVPLPARIEVLDAEGKGQVALDAIPVGGDCQDRPEPWTGRVEDARARLSRRVSNPHARTDQFYAAGSATLELKPGTYRVKATRGVEYKVAAKEVVVEAGKTAELALELSRWIDLPSRGWYGADGHLHIPRPHPELDADIARWMQAEDLHVANLLQFGVYKRFHGAAQYAHGEKGVRQDGSFIVAAGQENPRTHILGHTLMYGAKEPIHVPDKYLVYRQFWDEAAKQGAINGYAHGGEAAGAQNGLSIDLPSGLITFVEVLQFGDAYYDVWYNILNTGFRMAPIAGTDYPCTRVLPGRERFYTRVEGPLTYAAWIDGIRRGRTFVTNGPMIELRVGGRGIGDELRLPSAGKAAVEAVVRFDPSRDEVGRLDVVANGSVLKSAHREAGKDEIRLSFEAEVKEASWLAARSYGRKADEPTKGASLAHTAPVYVLLDDAPGLAETPRAKALARAWLSRLKSLRWDVGSLPQMGMSTWKDDVEPDYFEKSRPALRHAILQAMQHFEKQAR